MSATITDCRYYSATSSRSSQQCVSEAGIQSVVGPAFIYLPPSTPWASVWAESDRVPWVKLQLPGIHLWAPSPSLAPGGSTGFPSSGEETFFPLKLIPRGGLDPLRGNTHQRHMMHIKTPAPTAASWCTNSSGYATDLFPPVDTSQLSRKGNYITFATQLLLSAWCGCIGGIWRNYRGDMVSMGCFHII